MTRSKPILARLCPLIDLLLALGCAYAATYVTNWLSPFFGWEEDKNPAIFSTAPFIAGAAVAMVPLVLMSVGFYHRNGLQRVSTALRQLVTFAIYYLCGIAIYQVTRDAPDVMNHAIFVSIVLVPVVLFARYYVVRFLLLHLYTDDRRLSQVILAGKKDVIDAGWASLPDYWKRSLHVVYRAVTGEVDPDELQAKIEEHHVGQLILFGGLDAYGENDDILTNCALQGIDIYIHLKETHPVRLRADVNEIGSGRVLILSSTPVYSWAMLAKNVLDRFVAAILLLCSSPLWLLAAIGIKISDPKGPVFYSQSRSGLYGKPFTIWKFRSMYTDADQRLDEIKKTYGNEMEGPVFKLTNDPRIFPFGHFIRKFSIDELPQLLNILKGDMSIVGPRPLPVYETEAFPEISNRRRMSMKPGLTCYWQIEGRSDSTDFNTIIEKDLRYIDNWSLWLDLTLFLRTIPAVLFARGAK